MNGLCDSKARSYIELLHNIFCHCRSVRHYSIRPEILSSLPFLWKLKRRWCNPCLLWSYTFQAFTYLAANLILPVIVGSLTKYFKHGNDCVMSRKSLQSSYIVVERLKFYLLPLKNIVEQRLCSHRPCWWNIYVKYYKHIPSYTTHSKSLHTSNIYTVIWTHMSFGDIWAQHMALGLRQNNSAFMADFVVERMSAWPPTSIYVTRHALYMNYL